MAQLKKVAEPFGEVNVYPGTGGKVRVVATILMEPRREGAQTGIAIDGSGSMRKLYGSDPDAEVKTVAQEAARLLRNLPETDKP